MDDHADLAGTRLVSVNGHPIADVLAALEPLVPRDGPATVPAFRPIYLLKVAVLRGLGLVGDGDVELEVADQDGQTRTVSVAPVPVAEFEAWAGWLAYTGLPPRDGLRATEQRDETIWVEHLPEGAVYLRYPAVSDIPQAADRRVRRHDRGVRRRADHRSTCARTPAATTTTTQRCSRT